jgi:group I intron endonuclease
MVKNKGGIYLWTNNLTNECYVGRSINLKRRFNYYFNPKRLKEAEFSLICRALLKYGYENFSLEIIEYISGEGIVEREQYWISELKPVYNLVTFVDGKHIYFHTKESREKMSKFQSARFADPKQRKQLENLHDNWARSLENIDQLLAAQKKWLASSENQEKSLPFLKRKKVRVFNIQVNSETVYMSLTECANAIGCARSTISRYLLLRNTTGSSPIKGKYKISLIEE